MPVTKPPLPILIDTDLGIDDAMALLMALAEPGVAIDCITTVCGNVGMEQVTCNVLQVLEFLQTALPVYRGSAVPLFGAALAPSNLMGADGLGGASGELPKPRMAARPGHAAQQIVERAKRGVETLVMLGPLTNLALALSLDPHLIRRVRRLVIMGGASENHGNTTPATEFNFFADPEAAQLVLAAGFPELWLLPWETSLKFPLSWAEVETLFAIPTRRAKLFHQFSARMCAYLKDERHVSGLALPDPLAMAIALDPQVALKTEQVFGAVETSGTWGRGMLAIDWQGQTGRTPNLHLVTEIDRERVLEHLTIESKTGVS